MKVKSPHVHTTATGRMNCKECPPWDIDAAYEAKLIEIRKLRDACQAALAVFDELDIDEGFEEACFQAAGKLRAALE